MFLSYLALFGASLFEILWVALLGAHTSAKSHFYVLMLCACMGLSLYLLGVASKTIPITVSYAIWIGLGILGQAIIQHFVFKNTRRLLLGYLHAPSLSVFSGYFFHKQSMELCNEIHIATHFIHFI